MNYHTRSRLLQIENWIMNGATVSVVDCADVSFYLKIEDGLVKEIDWLKAKRDWGGWVKTKDRRIDEI